MRTRLIPVRGISEDDEQAWLDLAQRAAEPNPLFEPDCVIPIANHDPRGDRIHLAVAEEDGHFLAAMPIWDVMSWRCPYPVVTSRVRRMHQLGTPLMDPSAGAAALTTLLEGLARQRRAGRGRAVFIDVSAADGPVAGALRDAATRIRFHLSVLETYERGILHRRPAGDYHEIHSAKTLRNLGRKRRRLSDHFGGAEVRVVVRDANDPANVAEYVAMEAAGYKGRTNVAMTTAPGEVGAFTDMCQRMALDGRVHILALEVAGRTIAMQIWLERREGFFLTKLSYDEEYARFTPGVLLATESMHVFHDDTEGQWIDTCTFKGNTTLLNLYPDRRKVERLFIVLGRNPVDVAAIEALCWLKRLHRRYWTWRRPDMPRSVRGTARDERFQPSPPSLAPRFPHPSSRNVSDPAAERSRTGRVDPEAVKNGEPTIR